MKRPLKSFTMSLMVGALLSLSVFAAAQEDIISEQSVTVEAGKTVKKVEVTTSNGSIKLEDGVTAESLQTKQGSIGIGEKCTITFARTDSGVIGIGKGSKVETATSDEGKIILGEDCESETIRTVGGTVTLEKNAHVTQMINTDHGDITIGEGATVDETVRTQSGLISIKGGKVKGNIVTTDGGVLITDGTVVDGNLTIMKAKTSKPTILTTKKDRAKMGVVVVVGPNAEIKGTIDAKDTVFLYVHNTAKVGTVTGTTATAYEGDTPPKVPSAGKFMKKEK